MQETEYVQSMPRRAAVVSVVQKIHFRKKDLMPTQFDESLPNAMQSFQSCPPMQAAALYTTLLFSPLRLSPRLRSLIQIPNLAELIQTSDVEVRSEQRAEHRLSAW